MSGEFELTAEVRQEMGKGASRRLRRENRLPGVIYGGGRGAVALTLDHDAVLHRLENEAFYSHVLTVKVGDQSEQAVLKAVQRHPFKPRILHIDLQRVSAREKTHVHVPLHFVGEEVAPGVKQSGGVVSHLMTDVEVSCLPGNLPEFIEVDVSEMKAGETIHLSDLKLPAGVQIVALTHGAEYDQAVVSIHLPRGAKEEASEAAGGGEEGESS